MEFAVLRDYLYRGFPQDSQTISNLNNQLPMKHLITALLYWCSMQTPMPEAGLPANFEAYDPQYGQISIRVSPPKIPGTPALRIGEQFVEFRAASLYGIFKMAEGYLQPCPLTAYAFAKTPEVLYEFEPYPFSCTEQLSLRVDFYASCGDCALEDLQELVTDYLLTELWLVPQRGKQPDWGPELSYRDGN